MSPIEALFMSITRGNPIFLGLLGGLVITMLNSAGTLPILFIRRPSQKALDLGLGFSAGVMLAASFTSLIIPGIEVGGLFPVLLGIAVGAIVVTLSDMFIPHLHFVMDKDSVVSSRLKAVWLFAIAVTLHNMPEGLAVGIGFGAGEAHIGEAIALMLAIGLQNVPEGLAVGFSFLATKKYSQARAFMLGNLAGIVEIPLAFLGAYLVSFIRALLPYAMGFAAGAMIFVISDEIVPETHRFGHERLASYGLILGLIFMIALDAGLSP